MKSLPSIVTSIRLDFSTNSIFAAVAEMDARISTITKMAGTRFLTVFMFFSSVSLHVSLDTCIYDILGRCKLQAGKFEVGGNGC